MRTLWNILAFVAVVNLLALCFGAGWLWYSGRMDETRMHAVRELFRLPLAEVEAIRLQSEQDQQAQLDMDVESRRWSQVPATSLSAIEAGERWQDLERLIQERLEGEADALASGIEEQLARRTAELDDRERLVTQREEAVAVRVQAAQDEDFQMMVASLAELDEDEALSILMGWVQKGDRALVVSVLASIDEDKRTDLIAEMVKQQQSELAGNLLIELRDRGQGTTDDVENVNASSPLATRNSGSNAFNGGSGDPESEFSGS